MQENLCLDHQHGAMWWTLGCSSLLQHRLGTLCFSPGVTPLLCNGGLCCFSGHFVPGEIIVVYAWLQQQYIGGA